MSNEAVETDIGKKTKEKIGVSGREIVIHFFRHGETTSYGSDSGITEDSAILAFEAGKKLLNMVKEGESVKFITSPKKRATETSNKIQEGFEEAMEESKRDDIKLFTSGARKRRSVKMFDLGDRESEWFQDFKNAEDSVGFWLKNPVKDAESPKVALNRFKGLINPLRRASERLPSGPAIHYVAVSHSGPMRAFLNDVYGKEVGDLDFCESFDLNLKEWGDNKSTVTLRDKTTNLN